MSPEPGQTEAPETRPGRLTHEQVDHILGDITVALATSPAPGGRLSLEHVIDAAARALVPLLLAHLPLELERLRGRAPGANGLGGDERLELLRQIITRLASSWSDVATRLEGRLGAHLSVAGDEEAARRLHDRVAASLRETLPPNALGSGASAAPQEELAERVAEATVRLLTGEAVQDLRHEITAALQDAVAAPGSGERLADQVAHRVTEELSHTPSTEVPEGYRTIVREEIDAALSARAAAQPPAEAAVPLPAEGVAALVEAEVRKALSGVELSPDQVADAVAQRIGTPTAPVVAPERVAEALREPMTAAIQSAIQTLPERKMSKEELKRLSNELVAAMGGWVTAMLFGPGRRAGGRGKASKTSATRLKKRARAGKKKPVAAKAKKRSKPKKRISSKAKKPARSKPRKKAAAKARKPSRKKRK